MKKLCSVTQKVEERGFFKKSQLGRKKMLEKNTEEEMSSGKRGLVPADPELERQGVGLLLFCAVIKTCQNSGRRNGSRSLDKRNQGRSVKLLESLRLVRKSSQDKYPNSSPIQNHHASYF